MSSLYINSSLLRIWVESSYVTCKFPSWTKSVFFAYKKDLDQSQNKGLMHKFPRRPRYSNSTRGRRKATPCTRAGRRRLWSRFSGQELRVMLPCTGWLSTCARGNWSRFSWVRLPDFISCLWGEVDPSRENFSLPFFPFSLFRFFHIALKVGRVTTHYIFDLFVHFFLSHEEKQHAISLVTKQLFPKQRKKTKSGVKYYSFWFFGK